MKLRWVFGLIFLVMLALALAACGGGDDEEGNGGGGKETPAATKTAEAAETQEPAETAEATKTAEAPEPSGGGTDIGDIPVYPGAEKTGEFSGDYSLPLLGEDLDVEDYGDTKWAVYETGDSAEDVGDWYRGKMTDAGWNEENWFDTSMGDGAAWGSYTKNDGNDAAWVVISGSGDKTEIVFGTGSK